MEGGGDKLQIYLGGGEESAVGDDSVFESESETEDGGLEPADAQEDQAHSSDTDTRDGCFSFLKLNKVKVIFQRKGKKQDLSRTTSSKSSLSGSASGSVAGSVSGSDADFDSMKGSVSEPIPSNIPDYYATDDYYFDYPKRGYAVIINNEKFDFDSGYEDRGGSSVDETRLSEIFKKLGFKVKRYKNLQGAQIASKMERMAERDHTDKDCFACAILTHGGQKIMTNGRGVQVNYDIIFGVDGVGVSMRYLLEMFCDENSPTLAGKPRLFFIQACRGEKYDLGKTVDIYGDLPQGKVSRAGDGDVPDALDPDEAGSEEEEEGEVGVEVSVPLYRDFLVAYGAPPGHYAWRRNEGSWFVTSLHRTVMTTKLESESLMQMLARCTWEQALNFQSSVVDPKTGKTDKKQSGMKSVPHVTHMLTKDVFFRPKQRVPE